MFLPFLLVAAQVIGASTPPMSHPSAALAAPSSSGARNRHRKPASKPQAEAAVVSTYNRLVAAVNAFASSYASSHTVNARMARNMRRAWEEFEAAKADYDEIVNRK